MRLTRIVHNLQPDDTEVAGLLALMLLTDARRLARTSAEGELIPLAQQDRALWDKQQIAEGVALISATLPKGSVGPYQLQAAIAAVHDEAARADDTDWPQILALYDLLRRMSDNPMVMLNHAIAAAMVHGATKGLELLDALKADARLADHHRLDAVRAHLLELAGDREGAVRHYRAAAGKTGSLPERNYLLTQAARLSSELRLLNEQQWAAHKLPRMRCQVAPQVHPIFRSSIPPDRSRRRPKHPWIASRRHGAEDTQAGKRQL